jgi:hypothetical protein
MQTTKECGVGVVGLYIFSASVLDGERSYSSFGHLTHRIHWTGGLCVISYPEKYYFLYCLQSLRSNTQHRMKTIYNVVPNGGQGCNLNIPHTCARPCANYASINCRIPFASPPHGAKWLYRALKCSVLATAQERAIKYELDQYCLKIDKTFQVDLIKATFLLHFSITIVLMFCYNGCA